MQIASFEEFKERYKRGILPRWKYLLPYALPLYNAETDGPTRRMWSSHTLVHGLHILCPDENGVFSSGEWCWPWQWYRKYYATYLMRNR